jgi:acyl carrier protein
MSNYKVSLNGGNYVSDSRKKAFKEALDDNHTIQVENKNGSNGKFSDPEIEQGISSNKIQLEPENASIPVQTNHNSQGLKHSISHQNRTLDVHQQYLDQQDEYLRLIQDLIQQQGRIIDKSNPSEAESLIRQLQQSLAALNAVQDRGLEIHERFLDQQAKYSRDLVNLVQEQGTYQIDQKEISAAVPPEVTTPPADRNLPSSEPPGTNFPAELKTESSVPPPRKDPEFIAGDTARNQSDLPDSSELSSALLTIVAEKTGYPAEMLEMGMDLEADLGVDSIKRVEILGSVEEMYPELPDADTQILAETRTLQDIVDYFKLEMDEQSGNQTAVKKLTKAPEENMERQAQPKSYPADASDLTAQLLDIVADKTGYPVEMLESEMDMEADLGIDSIKRVEILGAMEEQNPDLPSVKTEVLAELRTLSEVIDFLMQESEVEAIRPKSEKKKLSSRVKIQEVTRIQLPDPDWLVLEANKEKPLLFVSAATSTALDMLKVIHKSTWPTVWIQTKPRLETGDKFDQLKEIPTYLLEASSDRVIEDLILKIQSEHGSPAGVILNPELSSTSGSNGDQYDSIRTAFFFAKHLQPVLQSETAAERTFFMVVINHQGQLGLGRSAELNPALGLSGLVKTLHWEWPEVFTRLVDLDNAIPKNLSGQYLLDEMHDPDTSLVEIGRSQDSRITLAPLAGRLS